MFDTNLLMSGIILSSLGMGYFMYGKKSNKLIPMLSGVALMFFPYFLTDLKYLIAVGVFLIILPIFVKIDY